jgi:hypothetical protein
VIAELSLYLASFASRAARRHGLLRESVGLWSRGHRQRKAWAPHEDRCRRVVAAAVEGLDVRRAALVLGSGLLRDVPMDLLLQRFERVVLVDVVHLWPVRLRYARSRKVEFVTRDLTGLLDRLLDRVGAGPPPARNPPLGDFAADDDIDLVISANLLSQLALPVERALERRPALCRELCRAVVEGHLADLGAFRARICLLTDHAYSEVDRSGQVVDRADLLHGVALGPPDAEWDWPVAPLGEEARASAFIHHVAAYADWRPV